MWVAKVATKWSPDVVSRVHWVSGASAARVAGLVHVLLQRSITSMPCCRKSSCDFLCFQVLFLRSTRQEAAQAAGYLCQERSLHQYAHCLSSTAMQHSSKIVVGAPEVCLRCRFGHGAARPETGASAMPSLVPLKKQLLSLGSTSLVALRSPGRASLSFGTCRDVGTASRHMCRAVCKLPAQVPCRMALSRFASKQTVTFTKVSEIFESSWQRPTLVTRIISSFGEDVEVQAYAGALDEWKKLQAGLAYVMSIPGTVVKIYKATDKCGTQSFTLESRQNGF